MSKINIQTQTAQEIKDIVINDIGESTFNDINTIFTKGFNKENVETSFYNNDLVKMYNFLYIYNDIEIIIDIQILKNLELKQASFNIYQNTQTETDDSKRVLRIFKEGKNNIIFDILDQDFEQKFSTTFIEYLENKIIKLPFNHNVKEFVCSLFANMEIFMNFDVDTINNVMIHKDPQSISFQKLLTDNFYTPALTIEQKAKLKI